MAKKVVVPLGGFGTTLTLVGGTDVDLEYDEATSTVTFHAVGPGKGLQGDPGVAGKDGADGVDGKGGRDGHDGKDGVDGRDGKSDTPGPQGDRGERGVDGPRGTQGPPGQNGIQGGNGAPGVAGADLTLADFAEEEQLAIMQKAKDRITRLVASIEALDI